MEAFAIYLFKSVVWLAGFTLVFILFLRNERFFLLNRIYLVAGILTSFFFPLISVHYTVVLPVTGSLQTGNVAVSEVQNTGTGIIPDLKLMLLVLYVAGILFVLSLIIRQGRTVLRSIKKSEVISFRPVKLIKTHDYTSAFSFFSYVFVNPSITDVETKEIMIHEMVHIRQKHWFDLLLVELLCMMQWFNPLVWIYVRFIRQNHEYLADEVALQQTSDPAVYRAVLLNQIVGAPVVRLANSFNYSLNKKRFNMMKNIISSPYRKFKMLLILPVFAVVLYAFAKPDYKYTYPDESAGNSTPIISSQQKEIKGTVVQKDGKPLEGAIITLRGTTIGTIADSKGAFKFNNVPDDGLLVVSYVGFKSVVVKPVFTSDMIITMMRDTVKYLKTNISNPPPPPPPPPVDGESKVSLSDVPPPPPPPFGVKFKGDGPPPLYVVDGFIVTEAEAEMIDPSNIESISVLKKKSDKYGEKGKDGVIEIITKKNSVATGYKKVLKTDNVSQQEAVPPPPPPPSKIMITSVDGKKPLYVINGVIQAKDFDINMLDPKTIESISVLKDQSAIALYGATGSDGVLVIRTKIPGSIEVIKESSYGKEPFVIVEEMPSFKGGNKAMQAWITDNLKYPGEAYKNKITGTVNVFMVVTSSGKVTDVKVAKGVNPLLDTEAKRVVSSMPDWNPGVQAGKPVEVQIKIPVEFKLQ